MNKTSKRPIFCMIFLFIMLAVIYTTAVEAAENYVRIAGKNRYMTAVEVSKRGWPSTADTVFLARGDDFADALSAVSLSYNVNAPILLTKTEVLSDETRKEIERLNPERVLILGGTQAIGPQVEEDLRTMRLAVERIAGDNRFETAVKVAHQLFPEGTQKAVIVYGYNFPDAMASASYAALEGMPILLSDSHHVPEATMKAITDLGINSVIIVGGTDVISEDVEKLFPQADRVSGSDRYQTAVALAEHFQPSRDSVFIATGLDFADAITGGVLAARQNQGILLVGGSVPRDVKNYFLQKNIQFATILGGPQAVSETTARSLFNLCGSRVIFTVPSQLYDKPGEGAVLRFPYQGYIAEVLEDSGDFLKVQFGSKEGWVSRTHVEITDKKPDYIRLGWQWMSATETGFLQKSPDQSGYNVYAPVMYTVNSDGITTKRDYSQNISLARKKGYQVWLTVQQFGTSPNLSTKVGTDIIKKALELDVDGVNIDFEGMGESNKDKFTTFIQDLYKEMKKNNFTLSVDIVRPANTVYSKCYDRKALAQNSDYLILMAYDQHWRTSPQEGSVADLPWTEDSITKVLAEGVPAEQLILGIPFYSRIWRVGIKPLVDTVIITGEKVNLRSSPHINDHNIIYTAVRHETFSYLGKVEGDSVSGNNAWYKIEYKGREAYVTSLYSSRVPAGEVFRTTVSSTSISLQTCLDIVKNYDSKTNTSFYINAQQNQVKLYQVEIGYDTKTQQTLVSYSDKDGVYYRIWLEDFDSLTRRRQLMDKYKLPGLAAWSLEWMDTKQQAWNQLK